MQAAIISLPIFLLAFTIHSGESIKCYQCNSWTDAQCADPFETADAEKFLVECTPDIAKKGAEIFNSASKKLNEWGSALGIGSDSKVPTINTEFICAKLDFTQGDKTMSQRSCVPPGFDKTDACTKLNEASEGKKLAFCETCDKDGCNGARSLKDATFLAIIIPSIALLLAHLH